jgi:AcrR family transcriptional regulator
MNADKVLRWERRPEERRTELLEAALQVFSSQGYRNTRLEEVAESAGVTKGTIYHYFENKEALLIGVIEHYQALAFGRAEEALQDVGLSASARIRLVVRKVFLDPDQTRRPMVSLLLRGVAHEVPQAHQRWLRDGPVWLWNVIAQLVAEGQQRGEFRQDADGEVGARLLVSGLLVQVMWQQHAADVPEVSVDQDRLIDSSVDLFLAGLWCNGPKEVRRAG